MIYFDANQYYYYYNEEDKRNRELMIEMTGKAHEERSKEKVEEELADVLSYCYMLADAYGLDVDEIVMRKMAKNEEKYPADIFRGSSKKYNEIKSK